MSTDRPLEGMVALVTGAGSGIGAACAVRLGRAGAAVGVNARRAEKADPTVRAVEETGARALAVVGDVTVPDDVDAMMAAVEDGLGPLDVVVSNAGMQDEHPFLDLPFDSWRAQMAVNLDASFLVGQGAARRMAARGSGTICFITSVHEHTTFPGYAAYATAKAGTSMLMRNMGRELAPRGVRVLAVAPGAITSGGNEGLSEGSEDYEESAAGIPAGRLGRPEEVGDLVAYLVSPAAAYVTATTVVIDGGLEQEHSES